MKLTNKLDLPQAIVDAVKNDSYSKGDADVSVTGLLKPPRLSVLEKQHTDEIVEDASDRIWSLMGQSIHTILERANRVAVAERRLSIEMEGWKISGAMDLYSDSDTLDDYKVTSVWKLVMGDLEDWTKQLNLYGVILRAHGIEPKKFRVHAILRDWSKREAARDPLYPQAQVVTVDVPVWPAAIAENFMRERIILHKQAQVKLPLCTPQDTWAKPTTWAVMKEGKKRADRVFSTEDEARAHAGFDKKMTVVMRPGEATRCGSYCAVSKFCSQYQASLAQSDRPADETNIQEQAG